MWAAAKDNNATAHTTNSQAVKQAREEDTSMEEQQQPKVISTPGQPDTIVPERKSLSVDHITISDQQYTVNKMKIAMHKLEALRQQKQEGSQS
jgi:hypothetical protein